MQGHTFQLKCLLVNVTSPNKGENCKQVTLGMTSDRRRFVTRIFKAKVNFFKMKTPANKRLSHTVRENKRAL